MGYSYGKAFDVTYYPTDQDGDPIVASSDNPTIYLFASDIKPSRQDAVAGTGAIATISSWTKTGKGYKFTVPAITEPDANEDRNTHDYHLAINFTLTAAGDSLMRRMALNVSRPLGYDEELNITTEDIEAHFDTVDDWITETKQNAFINAAIKWAKDKLEEKGYRLAKVANPEALSLIVINRALYRMSLAAIANGNQGFNILMNESKEEYTAGLSAVRLLIDEDQDSEPEQAITASGYMRVII